MDNPTGIAIAADGTVYVADTDNHRIRVIADGAVRTLAGTGARGYRDGPVGDAEFNYPAGLAIDDGGRLYVADTRNHRIRMIADGKVSTLAGSGPSGSMTGGFADGPATSAAFDNPEGVAVAPSGDIVVVDTGNDRVRLVASGEVSTLAGSGVHGYADGPAPAARFSGPRDVVVSRDGVIYVADPGTQRVRVIEDSQVRSVDHQFTEPSALATDGEGRLFVAEAVSEHRVWRLSVRKRRTGQTCWSPRMELRPGSVVLDSEATECTTNLCLGYAGGDADSSIALCSAFCGSAKDCPTSTEACPGGFGCVPPMTTGPIAGRAMCVCSAHKLSASAECAEMGR